MLVAGCSAPSRWPPAPPLVGLEENVAVHLSEEYARLEAIPDDSTAEQRSEVIGDVAISYHGYDLLLMASSLYRLAIEDAPRQTRWKYLLARVEGSLGNAQDAISHYQAVLREKPDHLPALAALAELQREQGLEAVAIAHFKKMLDIDPLCAQALTGLGRLALQGGDAQQAVTYLEEALRLSPGATGVRYPYGLALRNIGRTDEAVIQMSSRGDAFPMVPDRWLAEVRSRPIGARIPLNRGTTFFKEGFYEKALEQFELAVNAAPDAATAHLNKGSALAKLKRYPEANQCYQEALRLDSSSTTAWFDIGVIHAARGDDDGAIECYDRALLASPSNTDARFNRANALRRLKKFEIAAQEMRRVRTELPGQSAAWLAEVVCFIRLDSLEEAMKVCVEGLSATGRHRRLVSLHARLLATSEQPVASEIDQSLAEIDRLLAKQTTLEEVESKAMLLAASGRHADALRWQDAAIGAARNANRDDIVKRLQGNRDLYSRGFSASDPWPEEEPSPSSAAEESSTGSADASQDTSP